MRVTKKNRNALARIAQTEFGGVSLDEAKLTGKEIESITFVLNQLRDLK